MKLHTVMSLVRYLLLSNENMPMSMSIALNCCLEKFCMEQETFHTNGRLDVHTVRRSLQLRGKQPTLVNRLALSHAHGW